MSNSNSNDTVFSQDLPWLNWEIGDRVVVRRREDDGLYDALGYLLEKSPHYVVIQTRKGNVKVLASKMVTGKKVPPPPKLS